MSIGESLIKLILISCEFKWFTSFFIKLALINVEFSHFALEMLLFAFS